MLSQPLSDVSQKYILARVSKQVIWQLESSLALLDDLVQN
jgi:hypothetical protein